MSIVEVAKRAGVSTATVSFVINNKPHVSPETAHAVWKAIAELGYTPPPPGNRRGPRPGKVTIRRTNRIALLAWGLHRSVLYSPVYMDVLHGVESALNERGLTMVLHHLSPQQQITSESLGGKVDGAVLFTPEENTAIKRALRIIPCVRVMGAVEEDNWCDHVSYNNDMIGGFAARLLLEHGHRNCAYLGDGDGVVGTRGFAFQETLNEKQVTVTMFGSPNLFIKTADFHQVNQDIIRILVDRLLACSPRPTGLFVPTDMLTASVYLQLLERGVRPGVDIEIVSCNNERAILAGLHPQPAVIDIHAEAIGRQAVEQLLWRLEHRNHPRMNIVIDPALLANDTALPQQ